MQRRKELLGWKGFKRIISDIVGPQSLRAPITNTDLLTNIFFGHDMRAVGACPLGRFCQTVLA